MGKLDKECCGTCRFHVPFEKDRFMCDNMDAQEYQDETDYYYSCEEWEDKD